MRSWKSLSNVCAGRRLAALSADEHMAAASRFFAHEQRGAQAGGRRPSWLPPREVWSRLQDWKLLVGAHKHGWDNSLDLLRASSGIHVRPQPPRKTPTQRPRSAHPAMTQDLIVAPPTAHPAVER